MQRQMVRNQIEARGITHQRVIEAMLRVPRHLFVPDGLRSQAYQDHPLSIGQGQTISQPYIVAFMTEILNLSGTDKVLEIGTGSGYQAAVLAEICNKVFSIEINHNLADFAAVNLNRAGSKNVHLRIGNGYNGWSEEAPFDAIIVTCSPSDVPGSLEEQLAEGGRMIIPVKRRYCQELILLRKKAGLLRRQKVLDVRFVPMLDEEGTEY